MASGQIVIADIFYGIPLFTSAAALLALLLAFYALAARERKTPYIVGSIFPPVLTVLSSVLLGFLAVITINFLPEVTPYFAWAANALLIVSLIQIINRMLRIHNRLAHFRDDNLISNSSLVRNAKAIKRRLNKKPSYAHDPVKFPESLKNRLKAIDFLHENIDDVLSKASVVWREQHSVSLCTRNDSNNELDVHLIPMALAFLEAGYLVQYTTASRHPVEFVRKLRAAWENANSDGDWKKVAAYIVVVDAFTPHFGFTDSTHAEWSAKLERDEAVHLVRSAPTYAGVHTAAAKAFNLIKEQKKEDPRPPTLVIYESMYALTDLESVEQYRIFMRHVIPSERLWGGMFTVIAETTIPEREMALVRSYSDLDLSDDAKSPTLYIAQEE